MTNKEYVTKSLETCLKAIDHANENNYDTSTTQALVLHNIFNMLSAIAVSLADIADKLTEENEQEEA